MKNILKSLLLSTVIISACITTYEVNAGFFKNLFSSSDDKKEEKKYSKEDEKKESTEDKDTDTKANKKDKKSKESDTRTEEDKESNNTKAKDNDGKSDKKLKKKDKEEGKKEEQFEEENELEKTRIEDEEEEEDNEQEKTDEEYKKLKKEGKTDNDKELKKSKKKDKEDESKIAVKFKDGTAVNKSTILKEIENIPGQSAQKMSFQDMMLLFEFKNAYEKIINDEAKKNKLEDEEDVKKSLKDRQKAVSAMAFLSDKTEELMTNKELKKFYDDTWEKHIKGTNQISLILIQVPNEKVAEQIKKEVKNEDDLNKKIKKLKSSKVNVSTVPVEDYPENALPPEIIKQMKDKGKNAIIGPFPMQPGILTLFFVKSFHKAKKKEFSEEMVPQMKQLAFREFSNKYVESLIKEYKVEMYDLNGDKLELNSDKDKDKKKNKKQPPMLSSIKDTQVIAKIGDKEKITMKDLYKIFNIKSLDNEIFGQLAVQLRISIEEVIHNAIKLCIQDKLLSLKMEEEEYMDTKKVKKLCKKVKEQHLRNAYFAKKIKVTEKDAEKEYNNYIKMISPDEKDNNQISVKLVFFKTQKEAEEAIKKYQGQTKKFNEYFDSKAAKKDNVLDLGYVRRQEVPAEIWDVIKKCGKGTIVESPLRLEGAVYGFKGNNFAIARVGDRKPIELPKFKDTKPMFTKIAEKMKAIAMCQKLFSENVISIDGKPYKSIPEDMSNKLLIAVIQLDTRTDQLPNERN